MFNLAGITGGSEPPASGRGGPGKRDEPNRSAD
jgi:hypothetical protein